MESLYVCLFSNGHTQGEIATFCECSQPSISDIASGRTVDPRYSIGAGLLRMVQIVPQAA